MSRLIFWVVLAFVVLFAIRLYSSAQAKKRRDAGGKGAIGGPMVRCAKCGVFLPQADAIRARDGYRCREPGCLPKP